MEKFISYSQHADDYISWQFLNKKSEGIVVEVGAFDGQHLSNSKSLEDLGWKAINVEPNPVIFEYLKRNRPESINLNMAVVGDDAIKEIDFYAEELGVLSGCIVDEDDLKKRYKNRGIEYQEPQKIKVPAKTLNQILEDHEIEEVDVMSIDVEGFELEVLKGLDLNKAKINLLIIEANNEIIKKQIIDFFQPFKEFTYAGNNYQNLFFIQTKYLYRKNIKNLDFTNYIRAKQIHPNGPDYTLNSMQPNFCMSKQLIKSQKFLGLF
ncbi:FkbM family methyltransferase [Nonlabens dokdonensis]|uniref:Methyltransferase FkbM n=2 Tax=Nonlabens dokdonensis TaxID=328515 RepID=L7WBC5_NONDD|nr:FkbM family methyltransferase [Nonlabens dokdonensis]AGC77399.1 methyltransferase FkbM [Nonlabens dokdonensis DSW-6]PZX40925.1 FkbM family methyltransferase [Nonlabens dokdonensis]